MADQKNYITPQGHAALEAEYGLLGAYGVVSVNAGSSLASEP
ncbi:MAG: hypothetical protein RLY73_556 [Pseudomonadota bacterium]